MCIEGPSKGQQFVSAKHFFIQLWKFLIFFLWIKRGGEDRYTPSPYKYIIYSSSTGQATNKQQKVNGYFSRNARRVGTREKAGRPGTSKWEGESEEGIGRASVIGDIAAQWLCNEQCCGIYIGYKKFLRWSIYVGRWSPAVSGRWERKVRGG